MRSSPSVLIQHNTRPPSGSLLAAFFFRFDVLTNPLGSSDNRENSGREVLLELLVSILWGSYALHHSFCVGCFAGTVFGADRLSTSEKGSLLIFSDIAGNDDLPEPLMVPKAEQSSRMTARRCAFAVLRREQRKFAMPTTWPSR